MNATGPESEEVAEGLTIDVITTAGDFCSEGCRNRWNDAQNAQFTLQRSNPAPAPETIPEFVVNSEAPTKSPTEHVEHDPNEVDYADSEDEYIPGERVKCNNCHHWTPKDSTI